jgi:hypothetical protein
MVGVIVVELFPALVFVDAWILVVLIAMQHFISSEARHRLAVFNHTQE